VKQGGDGGVTSGGAGNYSGTMMATLPNGAKKEIEYVNGQLVTKLADGSVVHTQGGDYIYTAPKYDDDAATAGSKTASNNNVIDLTKGTVDISGLRNWLSQQNTAAKQAAQANIDYATNQGIQELRRAEEDAKVQFDAQRKQINIDEARAKDNQALYAEVRGNRGGIGAAQYDAIMNTAAQNRLAVNQAQTKLATDTARAIADLRAKGEFEKADALLELTQNYLGQLISLEQWALNYGVSVAQFKQGLDQWNAEFALQEAQITGVYKGQTIATKTASTTSAGGDYTTADVAVAAKHGDWTPSQAAALRVLGDPEYFELLAEIKGEPYSAPAGTPNAPGGTPTANGPKYYKVQDNGIAPPGCKVGDFIVTTEGVYEITNVDMTAAKPEDWYKAKLDTGKKNLTTANFPAELYSKPPYGEKYEEALAKAKTVDKTNEAVTAALRPFTENGTLTIEGVNAILTAVGAKK
jgi:hypothetical protein